MHLNPFISGVRNGTSLRIFSQNSVLFWADLLPGLCLNPGVLVVLDARPDGIIYEGLVPEYVDYVRTIYEDDFGDLVADVNYLNIGNVASGQKIFIC
ncbi:hypothetical protein Taro_002917 [Colocasia esculenta]|uniref:Uncharacterized protein n=1 Tax=Colocasia esculenta TaxID=4460 RepID=A0A843THX6_COLES|nr:hypothetical protein [Colocasia esculenta]